MRESTTEPVRVTKGELGEGDSLEELLKDEIFKRTIRREQRRVNKDKWRRDNSHRPPESAEDVFTSQLLKAWESVMALDISVPEKDKIVDYYFRDD